MNIKNELGKKILFFDGAMGTMLQKYGMSSGQLPELLNIENKEMILKIHTEYLEAGADILTTNTFGLNALKLEKTKYSVPEIAEAAIDLAKTAIKNFGAKTNKYVALDIGPSGKLLEPLGKLSFEDAYNLFKEVALCGEKYGADLIIIETLADTYEAKAAVLAAKENTNLPVFCTMTFDENGHTLTGADVVAMVALLEGLGADCIGINCGLGPVQIKNLYTTLKDYVSTPVIFQPNAGLPVYDNGQTRYDIDSDAFARHMLDFATMGASVLGGCCGTTPEHISKMVQLCKEIVPKPIINKDITIVSSYSDTVILGNGPKIIGERINPTGKKKFKEALKSDDIDYILDEALLQKEKGAHILDVNVGLPEIDEKDMMCKAVKAIQAILNIPLQLDSSSAEVLDAALRIYNGKALINSVNGKAEIMAEIFPLVKKYGGVVVALTLDEDGIPSSAEGRYKIAQKIIQTAATYGIDKKNIIIDPLTLTLSAQQKEAYETVKAVRMIKEGLGVKTVLGVSNISFGIPQREIMSSTFFAIALNAGLDGCIINPSSEAMMNVYRSFNALAGFDENCSEYVNFYSNYTTTLTPSAPTTQKADIKQDHENLTPLQQIIVKGLKDSSYNATHELLKTVKPMDIINNEVVTALDIVGKGYESGRLFLPQLMMSAETVKKAFEAIKEHLAKSGQTAASRGTVVMATVKGDIHDIGKNIVTALLENYGYNVIDLGKDVPIDVIVKTVKDNNVKLVGLSALMTTTVTSMDETIKALRSNQCDCKVMVGGAVLNQEYADMIGADFYGKDALASVAYANKLFG